MSIISVLYSFIFLVNSIIIVYSLTSIFASINMGGKRNLAIFDITFELASTIQIPYIFFSSTFRFIFTFIIPVTILVNPIYMILYRDIEMSLLIYFLTIGVILFIFSEFVWKIGLKKYTSAS